MELLRNRIDPVSQALQGGYAQNLRIIILRKHNFNVSLSPIKSYDSRPRCSSDNTPLDGTKFLFSPRLHACSLQPDATHPS